MNYGYTNEGDFKPCRTILPTPTKWYKMDKPNYAAADTLMAIFGYERVEMILVDMACPNTKCGNKVIDFDRKDPNKPVCAYCNIEMVEIGFKNNSQGQNSNGNGKWGW